jgi:hypothetical protein
MDDLPSISDFLVIAPLATLVVLVIGIGFYAGYKSQQGHIETLREFIDKLSK